jgi:hypothetical protein
MNQLESALIITLREGISWQSSLQISDAGTLTPVNPAAVFDPLKYQRRDRELAFRDMINAAAVAEVSIRVSDVWNYKSIQPVLQGPVRKDLVNAPDEQSFSGTAAAVRHVGYTSVPFDAAQYADKDLYGRDAIIYETLARACSIFEDPPISPIDSAGTIPQVTPWSLAEGQNVQADINYALPLNRDLFKNPDRDLADRDNQMAGYVANMVQVLKNPFEHAERLYIEVSGTDPREPELYVYARTLWESGETYVTGDEVYYLTGWYRALTETDELPTTTSDWETIDAPSERVFLAEPALSNRNRIVYNVEAKTLQWFRQLSNLVHVPQIVALSIPGIATGQTLDTLPRIPEAKDAQFWRSKASQIIPTGEQLTDTLALDHTASDKASGGYIQIPAASMTVPDTITFELPGGLQSGNHQVSVLVNPSPLVEISGAQNIQGTSGTLGGATFEVDPATISTGIQYLVSGGLGVVYAAGTYAPGSTFTGVTGTTAYLPLGTSKVQQFACTWRIALPPGPWLAQIDYTNLDGTTTGFGVRALYQPSSGEPVIVIEDTVPQPFDEENGTVVKSEFVGFDVADSSEFLFPVYWTYGNGQLQIRQITFKSTEITTGHYIMSGTLGGVVSDVDVVGGAYHPDILSFYFSTGTIPPPVNLALTWTDEVQLPIQFKSVQVQTIGTYTPTPNSAVFQGWRQEMQERATAAIQQSFTASFKAFGSNTPNFRNDDGSWDGESTEEFMSFIEVMQPRLREIDTISSGDITTGRQYEVVGGPVVYDGVSYDDGEKFYGLPGITTFTGSTVKQIGALMRAKAGHVGKPALVPFGVYFDVEDQTIKSTYAGSHCFPTVACLQPWMISAGMYIMQPEFWMPENT